MAEKITAKNKDVIQIGLSTHNQDHEINPVAFNTTKISVKVTMGSIPDRLAFFSIRINTSKFRFVEPIIALDSCHFNMFLWKPPKLYSSNTFLKRDSPDVDLPAVCVQKMQTAMAVIRITVLTMPGAKTEDAPSRRDSQAVMSVKRTAKEDC